MSADTVPGPPASGAHERRLAVGALAQQGTLYVSLAVALGVVTAFGRTLTLAEFGVYGLLVSFTSYLQIAITSVEASAVKTMGEAPDGAARRRALSIALSAYLLVGALSAVVIVVAGLPAVGVLGIPDELLHQARLGILALAVVIGVGWPLKTFHDALRGSQLFVLASFAEICSLLTFGAVAAALLVSDSPLWAIVALGGSQPALTGFWAMTIIAVRRLPLRPRREHVSRRELVPFLRYSGHLLVLGLTDVFVYSLDRVILGAFRNAAAIGLFEGPARAHNLIRQLSASLTLTVLPAAASFIAADDRERARDLLVRGTRYVVAVIVPCTIVLMVLAEPILEVWLGPKFATVGTALALFVSYWLASSSIVVTGGMLVAAGMARQLAIVAWVAAGMNFALSLALTPWLGIEGVVLGTTIPNVLIAPVILRMGIKRFEVPLGEIAREVWLPAFSLAVPIGAAVLAVRLSVELDTVVAVTGVAVAALAAYGLLYAVLWLKPNERALAMSIVRRRRG